MNASELTLTLPWDPVLWEADTAQKWFTAYRLLPAAPQYLPILKAYTNLSAELTIPEHLNALSRVLILHGLMSISWDLSRRSQTSLGLSISASHSQSWQSMMSACYGRWRIDFDVYTAAVLNALSFSPLHRSKFQRFTTANLAIYHTVQLILNVDIIDLQIISGAKHIIGRPVTVPDRTRSKRRIREWVEADGGRKASRASWYAAWLLRDGIRKLENFNADEMFHYPWCLYLSSLMLHTFHEQASKGQRKQDPSSAVDLGVGGDEDAEWDAKAEMNAIVSAITKLDPARDLFTREMWEVAGNFIDDGLIKCMARQLNTVRWAVVREGMIVLRGLSTV